MFNEDPKTNTSYTGDDEAIGNLLSGLKRVEAPGDFEFRVRAGIAERNASPAKPSWLTGKMKLAAPMALLLILGGYLGIGSLYPPAVSETPAVAETQPVAAAPAIDPQIEIVRTEPAIPANQLFVETVQPKPIEANIKTVASGPEKRAVNRVDTGAGSFDVASSESRNVIDLRNQGPNGNYVTSSPPSRNALTVTSVLTMMGIAATFTGAGWRVNSATGTAQRSGLKVGDVIEAINGKPVNGTTTFENGFRGRSLRIVREGKSMMIALF